jgi:hypothetical protein
LRAIILSIGLLVLPGLSYAQVEPVRLAEVTTFGDINSLPDSLRIYVFTKDLMERERMVKVLEKDLNMTVVNRREDSDLTLGFLSSTRPLNLRLDMWSSVIAGSYGQYLNGTRSTLAKEIYGSMAAFTFDDQTGAITIYWYYNTRSSNPAKDCTRKLTDAWKQILKLRGVGETPGGATK